MGSIISLGLGPLEIDWGKNGRYINHSGLFLKGDLKTETYFYAEGETQEKVAYTRLLHSVMRRLELLGYTLKRCQIEFESLMAEYEEQGGALPINFDEFRRIINSVDIHQISRSYDSNDFDFGEFAIEAILLDPEFLKINPSLKTLQKGAGEFFENLDPYVILRLLAENPANCEMDVIWYFADIVESGWVKESDIFKGLDDSDRILVVTEGSSDSSILKTALPIVLPDVVDFFTFIDMSENYPFTGAGNVFRFCQGLATIRIQNKVLVILDNDSAGHEAFEKISKLPLPPSMKVTTLPDLHEFREFPAIGPSGVHCVNLNGQAVSIECFLDLNFGPSGDPVVRWTSFNESTGKYQGELVDKKVYTAKFFENQSKNSDYDLSKLYLLWNHILRVAVA